MTKSIFTIFQKLFHDDSNLSRVHVLFRTLVTGIGALHLFAAIKSQSMNADGIAYLDIGDAYFRADWASAINPVWSPLYSWILGLVNFIIKPPMQWEFPVVHIINFLIYLFSLICFEFMWGKVRRIHQPGTQNLSVPLWWTLGYLLFIWTSLSLIQLWAVTPDMLMAGLVYLAAGLLATIRSGDDRYRIFLTLGLVLGLGYLSKTFMFAVAPVFLALTWLIQKRTWSAFTKSLLALGMFLFISFPFILLISKVEGKLTIGEAGTVTFLRYVNGIPFPHWQGEPMNGIVPSHPSRVIYESPAVYEFGEPIGGTYPISLDPSYWYEGIEPHLELGGLLARMMSSGLGYMELFFQQQGILLACVLSMYVMGSRQRLPFWQNIRRWALVVPAVTSFGLYSTILVEGRYVGVFIMLFWTEVLANIHMPDTANNKTWLNGLSMIAALGLLVNIALFNLEGFKRLNTNLGVQYGQQSAPPAKPLEVANTLHDLGIVPGDKVGVIGYAYDSFWARLAGVRIVAEMFEAEAISDFWRGDEPFRQGILQAFAGVGVDAVVAEYVPDKIRGDGWYQVENSNYYIYLFDK